MFDNCTCRSKFFKLMKDCQETEALSKIRTSFQSPKQVLYSIEPLGLSSKIVKNNYPESYEKVKFVHDVYSNISYKWIEQDCYLLHSSTKNSKYKTNPIIVLHLKNSKPRNTGLTLLFSHGNSSSLGTLYPSLYDLSSQLQCDILSYDYCAYDKTQGKSNDANINSNLKVVAYFAKETLKINLSHLILLGQSIGSAPTVNLSITQGYEEIPGVILISPIAPDSKPVSNPQDFESSHLETSGIFCNIKNVTDIRCPILIIHGKKDEVIPVKHSKEMAKCMKTPYEWYPRSGDHNNILTKYRTKFIQKCKLFFEYLNHFARRNDSGLRSNHNEKLNKNDYYIAASEENVQVEENNIKTSPHDIRISTKNLISLTYQMGISRSNSKELQKYVNKPENGFKRKYVNILLKSIQSGKYFMIPPECPFEERHSEEKSNNHEISYARDSKDFLAIPFENREMENAYNLIMKLHHGI